jgi:hypothetical protein
MMCAPIAFVDLSENRSLVNKIDLAGGEIVAARLDQHQIKRDHQKIGAGDAEAS